MDSREQFEEWAHRKAVVSGYQHLAFLLTKNEDGSYRTTWVDSAWTGWQASRKAIEIELPFLFPFYRQEVTEVLNAAGLKVKPC